MFRQDFTCPALLKDLYGLYAYGAITRYGRTFQTVLLISRQTTGLFRVRSPLLAESLLMSFPPGTEMFQFPGFASFTLCIHVNDTLAGGLPHSDIHGSTPARGSPWLFAACHVLHRLLVPRHPPNALLILEIACPGRNAQVHHAQKPSSEHRGFGTRHAKHMTSHMTGIICSAHNRIHHPTRSATHPCNLMEPYAPLNTSRSLGRTTGSTARNASGQTLRSARAQRRTRT